MKKNMEQLRLWIKTHKKKVAACVAVILLALGALGIGLAGDAKGESENGYCKSGSRKES